MKMKIIVFIFVMGVIVAQQDYEGQNRQAWAAIRGIPYEEVDVNIQEPIGAKFSYDVVGENEVFIEKEGSKGSNGQSNMVGSYHYPLENGTIEEVHYVANETGFHAEVIHHPPGTKL